MTPILHYLGGIALLVYALAVVVAVLKPLLDPWATVAMVGVAAFLVMARTMSKEEKADGNPPA